MRFALSGEEALQQLRDGPDPAVLLILSDINMPGMNGYELLKATKERWPALPVAMITAYGDDESKERALSAGASDFLVKPLDFDELKAKITQLLKTGSKA